MFKKTLIIIFILIAVGLILKFAVFSRNSQDNANLDTNAKKEVSLISIKKLQEKSIPLSLVGEVTSENEVTIKTEASGKIVVYNNYSTAGQKLIKDTRFETPNGLIFRIKDAVTVPGKKTVGGETVPGSLEVTVYADKEGDSLCARV